MTIELLTQFFKWCTIINWGLLLLWTTIYVAASDWVYRLQSAFFPITKEAFTIAFYSFLGIFKIFVIIFNLVPWIVLLIIR